MKAIVAMALIPFSLGTAWADYDSVVSADKPAHWFHLDETSGTTATDSGNSIDFPPINGTYNGGYTQNQTGIPGNSSRPAVTFNGSTGYIDVTTSADYAVPTTAAESTAVEVWFNYSSPQTATLISKSGSGATPYVWELLTGSGGAVSYTVYQAAGSCGGGTHLTATGGAYLTGAWNHVVANLYGSTTLVESSMEIYLNGFRVASSSSVSGNFCGDTILSNTNIARRPDNTRYVTGVLDEVAYYKIGPVNPGTGALTRRQVRAHYCAGLGISCGTHWPFTVKRTIDDGWLPLALWPLYDGAEGAMKFGAHARYGG